MQPCPLLRLGYSLRGMELMQLGRHEFVTAFLLAAPVVE